MAKALPPVMVVAVMLRLLRSTGSEAPLPISTAVAVPVPVVPETLAASVPALLSAGVVVPAASSSAVALPPRDAPPTWPLISIPPAMATSPPRPPSPWRSSVQVDR